MNETKYMKLVMDRRAETYKFITNNEIQTQPKKGGGWTTNQ